MRPDSSDTSPRGADSPWLPCGPGMSNTFMCGACAKPRIIFGRKLKRVRGLRTWVCHECAGKQS